MFYVFSPLGIIIIYKFVWVDCLLERDHTLHFFFCSPMWTVIYNSSSVTQLYPLITYRWDLDGMPPVDYSRFFFICMYVYTTYTLKIALVLFGQSENVTLGSSRTRSTTCVSGCKTRDALARFLGATPWTEFNSIIIINYSGDSGWLRFVDLNERRSYNKTGAALNYIDVRIFISWGTATFHTFSFFIHCEKSRKRLNLTITAW